MTKITYIEELKNLDFEIQKNEKQLFVLFPKKGTDETKQINFNFTGENAYVYIIAFIISTDTDSFPIKINSNISHKNCTSRINIRTVLFNKSQIDLKANIFVDKNANGSEARLSHKTLMMSEAAKTQTLPSLEIKCSDIKASHSATIGKINESEVFYLQSRGINKKDAKIILIKGFMESQISKIADKSLAEDIAQRIDEALPCTSNNCYCINKNCPC
ncbi:hypothetical protein GF354_02715 [Candidatus Peregrinibacteria bacterium]|nr:hypothetical protein [Candidatus Peregrinibacteria bacterium]